MHLAELYENNGDIEGCKEVFDRTLKKHKTSKKVWMAYQKFMIRNNNDAGAKDLLARSMKSLLPHKHVEVIVQYASAEFDYQHFENGRKVFEDLVINYPKRTDLWNVYVDKEIKFNNFNEARRIFERMITLKTNSKNVKAIFKKYLAFETQHGTSEGQESVKQKARDYVNSLM